MWKRSLSNGLGRLVREIGKVVGNGTMQFIHRHEVPSDKNATYSNMICNVRPKKDDSYRTRLTVVGDKLEYSEDASSPAASLLESKILFKSVILC